MTLSECACAAAFRELGIGLALGLTAGFAWTRYASWDMGLANKANAKWQAKKAELRAKAQARASAASPVLMEEAVAEGVRA
jgi:hypothetical protein